MNAAKIVDPRFNEALVADAWRLLARYKYKPSTDEAAVSLAVYWLYLVTLAYEGRAETI